MTTSREKEVFKRPTKPVKSNTPNTRPGFGVRPTPVTGGVLGMAGKAVQDLLDELADETAASKKIVGGLDQIKDMLPKAGSAASKIAKGTTNLLLKSKTKKRGGMNTDGVVDLSTEMVIDE